MPTIGIDLGTTNSLVAYWSETGAEIIPNVFGSNLTPSVVSIDENGEVYVGQIAKERLITHPDLTAATFKRYMGTEKVYHLGEYTFTPIELSSLIIRSLKSDAEAFFNCTITEAVISVPAYFNDVQRKATKQAAELTGLKVERLISEPTAAAISYGLHQREADTSFLVFDLGGGTFDVSVLEMFEGVMEVKSIAGDNFLGGEDFNELLVAHFVNQTKIDVNSIDLKTRTGLSKQAELCKRQITDSGSGKMSYTINNQSYEVTVEKNEYERLCGDLLLKLRHPIEKALRDAEVSPRELDAVILIGGATRMPVVRSVVSRMFGRLPYSNVNPDEAVALGAAIQAALKERNEALNEVILTDVCPYSLGINVAKEVSEGNFESGHFLPIIERNTSIPVSRVETLQTITDNQKKLHLEIYQGESRRIENNIKLGELNIAIPPSPAGEQKVDVRYTYDINGILEVEVVIVKTGERKSIIIEKSPGSLTQKEIEEQFKKLKGIKIHPRDRDENKLIIARGERLYEEALGDNRLYISDILAKFEGVLAGQDDKKIKKAGEELTQLLDEIEGRYEY